MPKSSDKSSAAQPTPAAGYDPDTFKPHTITTALDDSIAYQLRKTHKCFVQVLQPLLDQYDVPLGMWYFLRALWEEDGLTQREISDRVGLVAPTTVEQLQNMEKRGLLERHRSVEDRRKIHVYLTPEGRALRDKLVGFAPYVNELALEGLSAGEIGFLRLVLKRMQANLIRHAAESPPVAPAGRLRRG